jgi:hypothetical protein
LATQPKQAVSLSQTIEKIIRKGERSRLLLSNRAIEAYQQRRTAA